MSNEQSKAPFGFRLSEGGSLEICPERQDAVASAYGLLLDGASPAVVGAAVRALGFDVSDADCVRGAEAFLAMRRAHFAWGDGDIEWHDKN